MAGRQALRRRVDRRRGAPRREQHPAVRSDRQRGARRQPRLPVRVQLLGQLHTRRHPPLVPRPGRPDTGGVIMATSHSVDVVVIGAGPTGLTAAGDLARYGRSVVVLERWPDMNPSSRAFATMARTLEVLDARGLADDVLARAHKAPGVSIFAGARIDLTHLRSPYQFVAITPQTNVERALAGYAVAQGANIRRGLEVVALEQDTDGVNVSARPKDDDDPAHRETWRAAYVDRRGRRAQHRAGSCRRGLSGEDDPDFGGAGRRQAGRRAVRRRTHPRQQQGPARISRALRPERPGRRVVSDDAVGPPPSGSRHRACHPRRGCRCAHPRDGT